MKKQNEEDDDDDEIRRARWCETKNDTKRNNSSLTNGKGN